MPPRFTVDAPLAQPLRYGENPHQKAALYGGFGAFFQQLHGKELSYNNILDLTAAANLIAEFNGEQPALAILKHLREGCGTRATGRLVEVDKNTVTRYLAISGAHAERLHDELVAFSPRDP